MSISTLRRVQRVLVVEDQQTLGELLAHVLDQEDDLSMCGLAATGAGALRIAVLDRPDLAVVDLGLPDMSGIRLCRLLMESCPGLRVVVLTADARPEPARAAAAAGAVAFLAKSTSLEGLLTAIRQPPGTFTVDPALLAPEAEPPVSGRLSPREQEILDLMGRGFDARSISRRLHLSLHTTRGYMKSLYRKLGVHSQLEAVAAAARQGVLDTGT